MPDRTQGVATLALLYPSTRKANPNANTNRYNPNTVKKLTRKAKVTLTLFNLTLTLTLILTQPRGAVDIATSGYFSRTVVLWFKEQQLKTWPCVLNSLSYLTLRK